MQVDFGFAKHIGALDLGLTENRLSLSIRNRRTSSTQSSAGRLASELKFAISPNHRPLARK